MSAKINNLEGKRYGRLIVKSLFCSGQRAKWNCICDCGNNTIVAGNNLISGSTTSCGCLKAERIKKANTKHGHASGGKISGTYYSHRSMLQRCYDINHDAYERYGGRGITVCDRWKNSFSNFLKDMGVRPKGKELDRIDNNGNYEKDNCWWVTRMVQGNNKRNNVNLTLGDKTLTMSQWSREKNIPLDTLWRRLKSGWSVEKTLLQPKREYKRSNMECPNGEPLF